MSREQEEVVRRLAHEPDCQPCRFTGTASAFAIGTYILYHTRGGFYATRPYSQLLLRLVAAGAYYMSAARFTYLPPFKHLAPSRGPEDVHTHSS